MAAEDGFFSRWSRRKAEARPAPESVPTATAHAEPVQALAPPAVQELVSPDQSSPAPTLADVAQLTPQADFSRFVARNVVPQVRNAAMKKLFSDPHFNVMDGLDIYIDDYSIPSPLEPELVADMLASPFFSPPQPVEQASDAAVQPLAEGQNEAAAVPTPPEPEPESERSAEALTDSPSSPSSSPPLPHDHADLQLQPDPAAGPDGAGPGAG